MYGNIRARTTMAAVMSSAWLATTMPSEAQTVAGSWDVTWAQAVRYEDGGMEIQRWGTGLLELRVQGEQVTGTWTTTVLATVTWTVTGSFADGLLTLASTGHDSTNPELAVVEEMRWRAALTEDGLEGQMAIVFRGRAGDLRWRPWSATRS